MSRKISKRWKSKFARFVSAYGVERLARGLDVHPSAIYHWVRGMSRPKPELAAIIQRLARERGIKLSLDEIYGHARDVRATDQGIMIAIERRKIGAVIGVGATTASRGSGNVVPIRRVSS